MPAMEDVSRITADITEMNGWRSIASGDAKESWRDRAQLAAAFLRPGDVVCDLGAGPQPLRIFLPEGSKYIPVDCVDTLPGTHLADFDAPDFTLPAQNFNVLTALGVLNWLKDEEAFSRASLNSRKANSSFSRTISGPRSGSLARSTVAWRPFPRTFAILPRPSCSVGACSLPGHSGAANQMALSERPQQTYI